MGRTKEKQENDDYESWVRWRFLGEKEGAHGVGRGGALLQCWNVLFLELGGVTLVVIPFLKKYIFYLFYLVALGLSDSMWDPVS